MMEPSMHRTDLETLTHNLRWLRKRNGSSQKTMAGILKIGVGSLSKLEHGVIPPRLSVEFVFAVHDHFGIAPSALFSVWQE